MADRNDHDDDVEMQDGDYVSSEDEDFDPTAADAGENISSSSESEAGQAGVAKTRGRKRGAKAQRQNKHDKAEDLGFENSGDEATMKEGRRSVRKRKAQHDEDSGGEGGFVKTRSMRAQAESKREKKPLASTAPSTVDVDALWQRLNDPAYSSRPREAFGDGGKNAEADDAVQTRTGEAQTAKPAAAATSDEDMITITHTYAFAGQTTTTTKQVPRSSAQARLYLESRGDGPAEAQPAPLKPQKLGPEGQKLLTPLRRQSKWDPNPLGVVKGLPASVAAVPGQRFVLVDENDRGDRKDKKAPKLNVVDKSKMDWAELVDREGTRDELDKAAKAKDAYHGRVEFLSRVEQTREEELRNARRR